MTQLRLGKMKTAELATWFNIQYTTFRKNPERYYEILRDYCTYEKVYGGIIISEIYIDTYDKKLNAKDKTLYLDEIKKCVETQDGLSTLAGMSKKLVQEGVYNSQRTAERRLSKVGVELFGVTKEPMSHGEAGSREYVWAIKIDDYNHYRLLTPEEEKRFDEIITTCYSSNADRVKKAALLVSALRAKTINSDEYFEHIDRLGLNVFQDCIFQFRDETGHMIVHCTKHELYESLAFERE